MMSRRSIIIGSGSPIPIEAGNVPVILQDQVTRPIDSIFAQEISPFTLAADTPISGLATLEYDIQVSPGHGIVGRAGNTRGSELLLLDTVADRVLQCEAVDVVGDTISLDRPLDHRFAAASTLGRIVNTNMAVDGSVTPKIFTLRAGSIPSDYVRLMISMASTTSMDSGKFGGIPELARGLVLRLYNTFQATIFCFKNNGEIAEMCFDVAYDDRAPAGQFGFRSRITYGGQSKHGVVLRIKDFDVIQWVVQDDLTGLLSLRGIGQGHETN